MDHCRQANVEKFGGSSSLEAEGFDIVCNAIKYDDRLTIIRCGEGTRADFVVHLAGDPAKAIGVQLKTTKSTYRASKNCLRYRFSDTNGYEGLLILCMALDSCVQMWLVPGSQVKAVCMQIPVESQSIRKGWTKNKTFEADLADDFYHYLTSPNEMIDQKDAIEFMRPSHKNGQAEYDAFQRLKTILPIGFQPAKIEGSQYDYMVGEDRWQLKLASYVPSTDRYLCSVQKSAGRHGKGKKRSHSQYAAEDFEYLLCLMPADIPAAYLFPMSVLLERGKAGRIDVTSGTLHFYPHRSAHPKTEWVNEFKLDFSSQTAAIADYHRICGGSSRFSEPPKTAVGSSCKV